MRRHGPGEDCEPVVSHRFAPLGRVCFLDRDGVLNANRATHVIAEDDVRILRPAMKSMALLRNVGLAAVIVTNQAIIGRGVVTRAEALRVNDAIVNALDPAGHVIAATYMCPHSPESSCACRKPAPGMLLRAARDMEIDLASAFLVGDAASDVWAARAAGVTPLGVLTGRGVEQRGLMAHAGVTHVDDVAAAVEIGIGHGRLKE